MLVGSGLLGGRSVFFLSIPFLGGSFPSEDSSWGDSFSLLVFPEVGLGSNSFGMRNIDSRVGRESLE